MAEFLLELFSEEIPARMQARAEADLARLVEAGLKDAGLKFTGLKTYSTPRRLTLVIDGLPTEQPDVSEERRGPSTSAPEQAVAGFKRSLPEGAVVEEREEKKGTFYYAKIEKKGGKTADALSAFMPNMIETFPWPKSMRWGAGKMRWVRPLHSIICLLDGEMIVGSVDVGETTVSAKTHKVPEQWQAMQVPVPKVFENITYGHRFMSDGGIIVENFADYEAKLRAAHVMLDPAERREKIFADARKLAGDKGLQLVEDDALLHEVAGLVEWPVVLMGEFSNSFMDVPSEALVSEMKHHQKYFATRDNSGNLSPHFVFVANIEGDAAAITRGNERVLSARLSDAKFFWDQDRARKLDDFLPALSDIVFHKQLGTVADRVARMETLAGALATYIGGCDADKARRAAHLSKADLVSGMVGEFPDLQGTMGRYYAQAQGEDAEVAAAIGEHYSPQGPNDACPTAPVSVAVALAEKIDSLVGFFAINEKPTGSKDPFALRRAALGVIRLITENDLRLGLQSDLGFSDDLMAFFADRLKVQQKEKGTRHDLIDAVFSLGGGDDLVRLLARVSALQAFLATDDGENLLAGYKRASNIVRIEEKKDQIQYDGAVDPELLSAAEEKLLHDAIELAQAAVNTAVVDERFEDAMAAIAALRAPIDAFFENVTVNAEEADTRANRLRLLSAIRGSLNAVADFSKIEG